MISIKQMSVEELAVYVCSPLELYFKDDLFDQVEVLSASEYTKD